MACTCCEQCKKCLDYLLHECCSCVGLCPKPNATELASQQDSVVFDFTAETVEPTLWESLTASQDEENRWVAFTFPVDIHPAQVKGSGALTQKFSAATSASPASALEPEQEVLLLEKETPQLVTVNCTVSFLSQRMAKQKCKTNCATMGASAGRWFEDGCCECVGHNCQNYGVAQSRSGCYTVGSR